MKWRPVKKLNAPPDYNWNDEEVLYEKNDSWLTGFIIGWLLGSSLLGIFLAIVL